LDKLRQQRERETAEREAKQRALEDERSRAEEESRAERAAFAALKQAAQAAQVELEQERRSSSKRLGELETALEEAEREDLAVFAATSKDLKVWTNVTDEPVLARGPGAGPAPLCLRGLRRPPLLPRL
jgi:hypothetical protein